MRRALIIHSDINEMGGAELLSLRIAIVLKKCDYQVEIITSGDEVNHKKLENWFGIDLNGIIFISKKTNKFFGGALIKYARSIASAKAILKEKKYDFVISTYGELPIKYTRSIQFIHVPIFNEKLRNQEYLGHQGGYNIKYLARIFNVILAKIISGWSKSAVSSNNTICNSEWTRDEYEKLYNNKLTEVLYIGARTNKIYYKNINAWLERDNKFIVLGRIVPSKNILEAIDFIEKIRERGFEMEMTIIGNGAGKYYENVIAKIKGKNYIKLLSGLSKAQVEAVAERHKWGIHFAKYEHYGISSVELQRLGCITFVPDSCGQREVVESEKLRYKNIDDAIEKFILLESNIEKIKELDEARCIAVSKHSFESFDYNMIRFINKTNGIV